MSQNPHMVPPPLHGNIFGTPSKLMPMGGEQTSGSMPNIPANNSQQFKPLISQPGIGMNNPPNNPNGLPYSPASTPSFFTHSPALKAPIPNNVYNHNSSSQSSRNSSPAMNQSIPNLPTHPSPLNNPFKPNSSQFPPGILQQPGNLPLNLPQSKSGLGPPLLQSSQMSFNSSPLIAPSAPLVQSINYVQRPQATFPPSQSSVNPYISPQINSNPVNQNQISSNVPPVSVITSLEPNQYPPQLPPTSLKNENTSTLQSSAPNWQINSNAPPLVSSQSASLLQHTNQSQISGPLLNTSLNSPYSSSGIGSINTPSQNYQNINPPISNFPQPQGNNNSAYPNIPLNYPGNQQATSQPSPRLPPMYQNPSQANPPNQYPSVLPPTVAQSWNQQGQSAPIQQYNNGQTDLTQQMSKLNVTQNSFSQLWGQESVDLLQCRNVLPEEKLQPPVIKLNHHFSQSVNCNPEIFRCTITKIPETNNLLQKSRLPLGVLIHPFKDLNHLPVIQCSAIVRCRSCRTYINPFVYFVDLKRWKCNLCYRVNDLPDEFQYDPVSKTYGEPRRRPEIQSATLEYVAPSEYMLRPPQPAAYTFVLDVSAEGARAGYLPLLCAVLAKHLKELPGDSRTMLAFICFDHAVHYYSLRTGKPTQMTVIDIEDIFVPSPEDLLVNLVERRTAIEELLEALPGLHANPSPSATRSALGAALQAAHKLMAPTGGRITVFQSCLPNVGPGSLTAREDPNNRSSKEVAHLNPATDFYKRLALDCSGVQVAVDLFLLNSQYADLSTLSGISQFSGGTVYHFPLFKSDREWQAQELERCLTRYLTRKIGFEAVMRVRCTRGISIHTFHGSFFVRSTDLLSLPNVSPDAGFGMQLAIEESLADVQHVCFQAALLYTSSKGERRIRVHTLCLPVVNTLSEVVHSADQQCIIGLLAKMGVDRSLSSSLSDAREALLNAAVDALGAHRLTSGHSPGLTAPMSLRLLPLYLHALLKHPAFRTGTSTRLDDRIAGMCDMKCMPLSSLIRVVYPDLYPVHCLLQYTRPPSSDSDAVVPNPPRLHLSAEKVNANGAYLLDQETVMILYIGHRIDLEWLQNTLGVSHPSLVSETWYSLPVLETEENALLHAFINHLNDDRPYAASIQVMIDTSPNRLLFTERLLDDRVESALSYHEFLQHIKSQIK